MERPIQTTSLGTGSMRRIRFGSLAALLVDQERQANELLGQRMFSVPEFAGAVGANPNTVRTWLKKGLVAGYRTGRKGHWRIPASAVKAAKGVS